VTFDVGGTLIEPWPSVGHVYAEVARRFGVTGVAPAELDAGFAAAWRAKADFDYSRPAWFRVVRQTFREAARSLPPAFFPALYERFARADAWRVFDDVLPALDRLRRRGLRLGAVSNWDDRLRPLLTNLRLADRFDTIVVSVEVGCAKPAPAIFQRAAAALGVEPAHILHVGDSPAEDFSGAKAAGFQAALIQRGAKPGGPGTLRGLAGLVEGRGASPRAARACAEGSSSPSASCSCSRPMPPVEEEGGEPKPEPGGPAPAGALPPPGPGRRRGGAALSPQ
jgi:putative hydrolase of the HAD superfamily